MQLLKVVAVKDPLSVAGSKQLFNLELVNVLVVSRNHEYVSPFNFLVRMEVFLVNEVQFLKLMVFEKGFRQPLLVVLDAEVVLEKVVDGHGDQ